MAKKSTEFTQFKMRIRRKLRDQIEREAKRHGRSSNAEAAGRLEESFEREDARDLFTEVVEAAYERTVERLEPMIARIITLLERQPTWVKIKETREPDKNENQIEKEK